MAAEYLLANNEEYNQDYALGAEITRVGQRISVPDKWLTKVRFVLAKSGSPTGTLYCRVRDASTHGIILESSDTIDVSTLSTTSQWYEFTLDDSVQIGGQVDVCVEWQGDVGNVHVRYADFDVIDSYAVYYGQNIWTEEVNFDLAIKLYYIGADSGEISFGYYQCQSWSEDSSHGGDIDLLSPIASGNIFDDISGKERKDGDVEYRKIYIRNDGFAAISNCRMWIGQNTPADADEIFICASGNAQDTVQDATGYSYVQPSGWDDGYLLGDLNPNEYHPIWIKRVVSAGFSSYLNNSFQLIVGQK